MIEGGKIQDMIHTRKRRLSCAVRYRRSRPVAFDKTGFAGSRRKNRCFHA